MNARATVNGAEWSERCEHWSSVAAENSGALRKKRELSAKPLILCGHGISLRIENGTLAIKNGFTHFPQEQETFRYFRGDLDRPARIIVLDGSGHLTFDVLDWLAEQGIPLIRVSWTGEVTTVIGGSGYSADRDKLEWQRATRADPVRRVEFASALIRTKIENGAQTLKAVFPASAERDAAIGTTEGALAALKVAPPADIPALHGIEGKAAAAYFEAWHAVPLCWRADKRRPIPDAWRTLGPRASLRAGKKSKNRNATHPVNAMLNYAYAVAVGQLKIQALAEGYDPTLGITHQRADAPAFALDLVEPIRPLVDRAILAFAFEQTLHPADFVIRDDGACRLNPHVARRVVELALGAVRDSTRLHCSADAWSWGDRWSIV